MDTQVFVMFDPRYDLPLEAKRWQFCVQGWSGEVDYHHGTFEGVEGEGTE